MGGGSSDWSSYKESSYDWDEDEKVTKKSASEYAKSDRRVYSGYSSKGIPAPVGVDIKTDSPLAEILVIDITGSMHEWPKLIFQKIPTLYNESNAVMQGLKLDEVKAGKDIEDLFELSVIAMSDARHDSRALQVVDFSKGPDLVNGVNKIFPEGDGGSNRKESYELAAYYILNHCKTPNLPKGTKMPVIIAGDEGYYPNVDRNEVKRHIGDELSANLDSSKVMKELKDKFDVYILRPEPCHEYTESDYAKIRRQWKETLDPQRVLFMENPERLVDCIIGINSYAANNFDEGLKILERRQTPKQVKEVLDTLKYLK